jgi:hypothetical protein
MKRPNRFGDPIPSPSPLPWRRGIREGSAQITSVGAANEISFCHRQNGLSASVKA